MTSSTASLLDMPRVSFPHTPRLVHELTQYQERLKAKMMQVVEEIQSTVEQNELAPEVADYAENFGKLLGSDRSTGLDTVRACFGWLPDLDSALALCAVDEDLNYVVVRQQMTTLVTSCRDLLVVRAQFLCPVGDKDLFREVLLAAHGTLSSELYSKVMNAYSKALSRRLPHTFQSNSSLRRKRPRKRPKK